PYCDGRWAQASVKSIHLNKTPVEKARAGSFVTIALDRVDKIEKGMAISTRPLKAVREITAEVLVLRHPTIIRPGFSGVFHYKAVRTGGFIKEIDRGELMVGDSGVVKIELSRPWHVDGGVFVFRNGPTRVLGRVIHTY
ncbi:MAG: GTP-binding protein, partial [Thermoproteus sp.]